MKLSELKARLTGASKEVCQKLIDDALAKPEPHRSEIARYHLKEYNWYLHEGDLWLDGDVIIDIPLIVTGDLIIGGICSDAYNGMLLVMGTMRSAHIVSQQSLFVWGDLICGGLCYQYYNDNTLEVLGTVAARAFISEDKAVSAGAWKVEGYYNSLAITQLADCADPYQMLGFKGSDQDEDEDEDDKDGGDDDDGERVPDAGLPPFPTYGACLDMLLERRAAGRDAFTAPLSLAGLSDRWGEDWAWRKRMWYPHRAASQLTTENCAQLMARGPEWLFELIVSRQLFPSFETVELPLDEAALDQETPTDIFLDLKGHPDRRIRWALASSPDCPPQALRALAKDADATVRAAAASSVNCAPALRDQLMTDADWRVRVSTIFGLHADPCRSLDAAALTRLASDDDARVRCVVAAVPNLPAAIIEKLAADPDSQVSTRLPRFQTLDVGVIERQAADEDADMRLAAARQAFEGAPPFDVPEHQAARDRILQKLMLDADESVRDVAANGWQPFPFYEEHAEAMSRDTVPSIRRLLAGVTRNPEILARLAEDENAHVREAVAENPNTPAEVLTAMCRAVKVPMMALIEEGREAVNLANTLSDNPCLPVDAIAALIEKEHEYNFFQEQPNLTPQQIVERLECDDDDAHAADYAKCRAYFPELKLRDQMRAENPDDASHWAKRLMGWAIMRPKWIAIPAMIVATVGMSLRFSKKARKMVREDPSALAEPTQEDIAQMFNDMLASRDYRLCTAALMSAHCPPQALAQAVTHYVENVDKGGPTTTIRDVAANPALPAEARAALVGRLKQTYDYEVCKGLTRNPSVTAEEWLELATGAADADNRREAVRALWVWHGQVVPV